MVDDEERQEAFVERVRQHMVDFSDDTAMHQNRLTDKAVDMYRDGLLGNEQLQNVCALFEFASTHQVQTMWGLLSDSDDHDTVGVFLGNAATNLEVSTSVLLPMVMHPAFPRQGASDLLDSSFMRFDSLSPEFVDVLLSKPYADELDDQGNNYNDPRNSKGLRGAVTCDVGVLQHLWDMVVHELSSTSDALRFFYVCVAQNPAATPDMLHHIVQSKWCTLPTALFLSQHDALPLDARETLAFLFSDTMDRPDFPEHVRTIVETAL